MIMMIWWYINDDDDDDECFKFCSGGPSQPKLQGNQNGQPFLTTWAFLCNYDEAADGASDDEDDQSQTAIN